MAPEQLDNRHVVLVGHSGTAASLDISLGKVLVVGVRGCSLDHGTMLTAGHITGQVCRVVRQSGRLANRQARADHRVSLGVEMDQWSMTWQIVDYQGNTNALKRVTTGAAQLVLSLASKKSWVQP